jgi:hypothetical protein
MKHPVEEFGFSASDFRPQAGDWLRLKTADLRFSPALPVFVTIIPFLSMAYIDFLPNWLCFFKLLFAIHITQYSIRNRLAPFDVAQDKLVFSNSPSGKPRDLLSFFPFAFLLLPFPKIGFVFSNSLIATKALSRKVKRQK